MNDEQTEGHEDLGELEDWETPCSKREDGLHCAHWYDGGICCSCGAEQLV